MELSVLKATKILLKLNQQHGEVLTRLSSMKRRHSGLRAISVGEAAGGGALPILPPHSETSVDMLRTGDLCGQQMQLWSVRVGSPAIYYLA